jgi:hypothetical protein
MEWYAGFYMQTMLVIIVQKEVSWIISKRVFRCLRQIVGKLD